MADENAASAPPPGDPPLRVLQIVGNSVIGGAENHVLTLARELTAAGHAIAVVCPRPGPLVDSLKRARIETHLVEMVRPAPDDDYDLTLPGLHGLVDVIRRWHPDVVHSHLYPAHLHATLAGRLEGVPAIVTTAHTLIVRPGDQWLIRSTPGRVISVSEAAKRLLVQGGVPAGRIRVIYNGIEGRYFTDETARAQRLRADLGIAPGAPVVGMIARLSPEKGHDTLLQVAADVVAQQPDVRFLIVGTGPIASELKNLSDSLGLGEHVIFTGARTDVGVLNRVLDVFALPSREEALPLAVLEAMAARRPVVASAVGGVPEVVVDGDTGMLLEPDDRAGFAAALLALVRQPGLRGRMGTAGERRVRTRFGVNQMIRSTVAYYRSILRAVDLTGGRSYRRSILPAVDLTGSLS